MVVEDRVESGGGGEVVSEPLMTTLLPAGPAEEWAAAPTLRWVRSDRTTTAPDRLQQRVATSSGGKWVDVPLVIVPEKP